MVKKNKKINFASDNKGERIKLGDLLGGDLLMESHSIKDKDTKENVPSNNYSLKNKRWRGEAEIWLSKKGRGGKIVSLVVLSGIGQRDRESLFKKLKKKLACGGNIKAEQWIVQTSKRDLIKDFLEEHQIKSKICGG